MVPSSMFSWLRERFTPWGSAIYPVDARVPPIESWPSWGIAGRIGSGDRAGEWVAAVPEEFSRAGAIRWYSMLLPDEDLYDTEGKRLMSDGVMDGPRRQGVGGLVDALTTDLDIEWFTDRKLVEDFLTARSRRL